MLRLAVRFWRSVFCPVLPRVAQQSDASIAPRCIGSSASFCHQTLHDKFLSYAVGTFGPRALFVPLFPASYLMAFPPDRYPRDWREGLPALGRNYGDQVAAQTLARSCMRISGIVVRPASIRWSESGTHWPTASSISPTRATLRLRGLILPVQRHQAMWAGSA